MTEYIAIDLETKGLIEKGVVPEVICWSWATKDDSGVSTSLDELMAKIGDKKVVYHNASFDNAVLRGHGIEIEDYEDTMIMSYCQDPSQLHSLKAWGERLKFNKLEKPWEGHYPEEYTPELEEYCKRDAEVTIKLLHYFLETADDAVMSLYRDVELPYSIIIQEMEETGMFFNREEVIEFHSEIQEQLSTIEHEIINKVGDIPAKKPKRYKKEHPEYPGKFLGTVEEDGETYYEYEVREQFNLNSRYHKAYALQTIHPEWKPDSFAKDGTPTVSSDVLSKLSFPLAKDFQTIAKLTKLDSSFIKPILDYQDDSGFVYGSFNQCVTITGRLSSSNPNLQNIPSRGEMGAKMRSFVCSPHDDIDIVGGDLN